MTIDEAIAHCFEVAEENEELSSKFDEWDEWEEADANNCRKCAADHRQLAEWLTELKELKNSVGAVKLETLKEAQAAIEKRDKMLRDTVAELCEAKRLLRLAVEDFNCDIDSICAICKHNDLVDGCPYIESYSECEYNWRYTDEALKLIGDSENG